MPKVKKIPQRQCVGCREMKEKKALIRVVKSPEGEVSLDEKGRKPGRGAYVCPNVECLRKARKSRALERAFETQIPPEVYDAMARELVEQRKAEEKLKSAAPVQKVSLENLFDQIQAGERKELALIVKADVQGSVEAVRTSLEKLSNDEVGVRVIHGGVGAISESDVMLAASTGAIIVGFNVRPDAAARDGAMRQNVDMRMYRVIYDCIDEIEAAMKGMLAPKFKEVILGHAEVRLTYKVSSVGTVAGCYVQDGKLTRDCDVRVVRGGIVVHEGKLGSLQRFKDTVKEVTTNYECGLTVEKFNDLKEGDIIEGFAMACCTSSTAASSASRPSAALEM